jgi:hypothetical protein
LGTQDPLKTKSRVLLLSLYANMIAQEAKKKNIHTEIEKKNNFVSAAENSSNRNSEPPKCPIAFTLAGPVLFSFLIIIIISSSLSKASSVCLCVSILLYGAQQDRTT